MANVNTVLGPLDTSKLGFTLAHEHILPTSAGIQQVYPELIDREGTIRDGVAELRQAHREGVRTLVDVTTFDAGRDVRLLEEVSSASAVNIICCTGIWMDVPRAFWGATPDTIASLYVREIEESIEGTGIKAGIIKASTDKGGITPVGEITLRAAARAQRKTGVPITTHTLASERVGEQQVRIFQEEGVDLDRVYIGHSNDTTDMDYLTGLLRHGVWLGLDRMPGGRTEGTPDWHGRTEIVKRLIDAGFADRIMLSHDASVNMTYYGVQAMDGGERHNPDGFLFTTRHVLPMLREMGVPEETITQIMVNNPRRFFEGR